MLKMCRLRPLGVYPIKTIRFESFLTFGWVKRDQQVIVVTHTDGRNPLVDAKGTAPR